MPLLVPTSAGSNLPGWIRAVADTVNGLVRKRLVETTITAATTLTDDYDVYLCDATDAAFTVTLPKAGLYSGKLYYLKKIDSSANAITIDADGSETIDGAATQSIDNQYQTITLFSDGTGWNVVPISPTLGTVSVTNGLTFNTSGGAAPGATFDGSAAVTVDYSTVGAVPSTRALSSSDGTIDGVGALSGDLNLSADEQAILDQITTTRGAVLYRGSSAWAALTPGTNGFVLQTGGAGADPSWVAASGGGISAWALAGTYDFGTQPATSNVDFANLGSFNELLCEFLAVGADGVGGRLVRVSTDNGVNFYSTSGDYKTVDNSGVPSDQGSAGFISPGTSAAIYFTVQIRNTKGQAKLCIPQGANAAYFVASTNDINAVRFSTNSAVKMNSGKIRLYGR